VEQSLHDKGFDIAALAEDLKSLGQQPRSPQSGELAISCFSRAVTLARELCTWHESAVKIGWISADWPQPMLDLIPPRVASPSERKANIDLSILHQSIMILEYWALTLVLSIMMSTMRSKMPPGASVPAEIRNLVPEVQLQLSKNILAVVPYQTRGEHGFMAASRCTLAIRVALNPLRLNVREEARVLRAKAESFLVHLAGNRGVRFASTISKVSGEWGDTDRKTEGVILPKGTAELG
jgi:hypothetical protein